MGASSVPSRQHVDASEPSAQEPIGDLRVAAQPGELRKRLEHHHASERQRSTCIEIVRFLYTFESTCIDSPAGGSANRRPHTFTATATQPPPAKEPTLLAR